MQIRTLCILSTALSLMLACGSSNDSSKGTGGAGAKDGGGSGGTGAKDGGGSGGTGATDGGGSGGTDAGGGAAGAGGAAGTTGCGDYGQVQACKDCLSQKCCAKGAACAAEADCNDMVTCDRQCPSPTDTSSACVQTCAQQHNLGGKSYNDLILCMGNSCGTVCGYL